MLENNNENSNVNYIFIVFIAKQLFRDNSNRLYDQEVLKLFFSKEKANVFARNFVREKFQNDYNQNELTYSDDNLFIFYA